MDKVLDSYVSTLSAIKKNQNHQVELTKRKREFSRRIYEHMIKNDLKVIEHDGQKITLSKVKPLEISREEAKFRKEEKRNRILEKVSELSENPDEIMQILCEEFRLKK